MTYTSDKRIRLNVGRRFTKGILGRLPYSQAVSGHGKGKWIGYAIHDWELGTW